MIRTTNAWSVLLVLVLLLVSAPVVAQGQTTTDVKVLRAAADSSIAEGSGANFGWFFKLNAWERGGDDRWAFLMFDLGEIPAGSTVLEARLKLFIDSIGTLYPNPAIGVHYCPSNDWTEDGITYNNMPAFDATPLDTVNVTIEWRLYRWNVTAAAQTTLNARDRRLSLVVKAETKGTVEFASRQAWGLTTAQPDVHPQLTVPYQVPPLSGTRPVTNYTTYAAGTVIVITLTVIVIALGRRSQSRHTAAPTNQETKRQQPTKGLVNT